MMLVHTAWHDLMLTLFPLSSLCFCMLPTRPKPLLVLCGAEVDRRMRKQEANWESSRRETRKAYLARLRRTALRLPADFGNKSIGDMRKRCLRLKAAAGKHFREGA